MKNVNQCNTTAIMLGCLAEGQGFGGTQHAPQTSQYFGVLWPMKKD